MSQAAKNKAASPCLSLCPACWRKDLTRLCLGEPCEPHQQREARIMRVEAILVSP